MQSIFFPAHGKDSTGGGHFHKKLDHQSCIAKEDEGETLFGKIVWDDRNLSIVLIIFAFDESSPKVNLWPRDKAVAVTLSIFCENEWWLNGVPSVCARWETEEKFSWQMMDYPLSNSSLNITHIAIWGLLEW